MEYCAKKLSTECPKIYRKSVLHLYALSIDLWYTQADAVQICG